MKTQKERMIAEELYSARDKELRADSKRRRILNQQFNQALECSSEQVKLLHELFKQVGESIHIEPPMRCEYGFNMTIGHHFYANWDCIFLDVAPITIGNHVYLGPRVSLYTAGHPIDASIRNLDVEFGKQIHIGNAVVNPGVTIGNDVVIGSGSVVTNDIPSHSVAVGNPCRVIRSITAEDHQYWQKKFDLYNEEMKLIETDH